MAIAAEDVTVVGTGSTRACFAKIANVNSPRRGFAFPRGDGEEPTIHADVLIYFDGIVSFEELHYCIAKQQIRLVEAGPVSESFQVLIGMRYWTRLCEKQSQNRRGGYSWRELPRRWHFAGCYKRQVAPWVRWGTALRVSGMSRWVSLAKSSHVAFVDRDDVEFIVNADWLSSSCCEIVKIPEHLCLFPFQRGTK